MLAFGVLANVMVNHFFVVSRNAMISSSFSEIASVVAMRAFSLSSRVSVFCSVAFMYAFKCCSFRNTILLSFAAVVSVKAKDCV